MGVTNLKVGLERKYSIWLGEKKQIDKEIKEILGAYTKLAEKQIRAERLDRLLECSVVILQELAPNWEQKKVRAKRPGVWTRNFETGMLTRWTFDVLREATEMMTSRQIALKIAEAQGLDAEDKEKLDRIRASVDTNLRKKVGKTVEKHGDYPCYWKLIDFDDRPDAMPSKP